MSKTNHLTMKLSVLLLAGTLLAGSISHAQSVSYQWKTANSGGYSYKYVTNDPGKARFYTLKNGLTVVLSPNDKEPVIYYRLAVRAGSNTDPKHATGLAHYLEHLLFKGTDKFGTQDFAKEKPLLDKIGDLYEQYNKTTDPAKRAEIYREIDKTSGEASNYSIANEYDKMMTAMGGTSTNAHTWFERKRCIRKTSLPTPPINSSLFRPNASAIPSSASSIPNWKRCMRKRTARSTTTATNCTKPYCSACSLPTTTGNRLPSAPSST